MAKRKLRLTHRKQRSILTDMLPFEVPPTFSNRGYYKFLRDNEVEIEGSYLYWTAKTDALDKAICILFGCKHGEIVSKQIHEWGKCKERKSIPLSACKMNTIPFNFRVSHNLDGRTLSIIHPRNQVDVANFYTNHNALIRYYTSVSDFSIRHPIAVSRYVYFNDKLHQERFADQIRGVEEENREYEQLGSYFVYRKYSNIHRFFESYKYHQCEKKYNEMVQLDIARCFDSIYTHSLSWAVLGKLQTKFKLEESKQTFAGKFDALMQRLNHKETNGIVIGPEFSRIFAEIILQSIDVELLKRLADIENLTHKIDYEVFRYVDDYFVFYNKPSTQSKFVDTLQEILRDKNLSINRTKIKEYPRPIITEITIAKERVSSLMNSEIVVDIEEASQTDPDRPVRRMLTCNINANRLILKFKTIIKETGVEYSSLLNFTFAIVEKKLVNVLHSYTGSDKVEHDQERLLCALLAIMEFSFFIYSANPKVNHTIRICRMISVWVNFINLNSLSYEFKHLLFKYVHDNILQQLEKNMMGTYREVESLYLLISMTQIGKEYWLPESTLTSHFRIQRDKSTNSYERANGFLSHFSITVLLSYIKKKARYLELHKFIEIHVIAKLEFMKAHCHDDAEALILFLDLIVCPYISTPTKHTLGKLFGLGSADTAALQGIHDRWFTAWDEEFDLLKELDAKRSCEVY